MTRTIRSTSPRRARASAGSAVAALVAVLAVAAPTRAADDAYEETGPYVGVSGVYTHNFFDAQVEDAIQDVYPGGVHVDIDDSWGFNARIGYRAASWFALELQYEYIDEFDVKARVDALALPEQKVLSIDGNTLTANARLIAPFWRAQPYVLVGAGYSLYESQVVSAAKPFIGNGGKQSGFAGRAGGGLDLYLTPALVLNGEVTVLMATQDFSDRDLGNIDDLWYVSAGAGLRYQF